MTPPLFTISDARVRADLHRDNDQFKLSLTDLATGHTHGPAALMAVTIYEKMERRERVVRTFKEQSVVQEQPNQLRLDVANGDYEFSFSLWLTVDNGELVVRFETLALYERMPQTFRLLRIDLLDGLMRVAPSQDGRMLMPLHSGVLCDPRNKPALRDRFMIYGEQSRWELLPTLPVCAVHDARGGLMALATSGATDTECRVETDGCGGGTLGFGFSLRQFWPDPLNRETRVIRYCPLRPGDDLLHATAKRLRRHVMEDLGKPTLRQRAEESPEMAYFLGASVIKLFHGMQRMGFLAESKDQMPLQPFDCALTFDEAADGLRRLHAAGIDQIITQSVGWNPRGHDGMWPTRFPVEPRVGGEAGFRRLVAEGDRLGYQINVHDNYLSQYRASPDFDASRLMCDQWGQLDLRGYWGGGECYVTNPLCQTKVQLDDQMEEVKRLGIKGLFYMDGMANPLECSYPPNRPFSRGDYAIGTAKILQAGRRIFGAVGTECGFLYGVVDADCMVSCGNSFMLQRCNPEWPISQMFDQQVPLWQLALHGLIIRECHGLEWSAVMRGVLFADHPRDEWSCRAGVHPALDDARVAAIKAKHDVCLKQFGHLQLLELDAWSNPAPQVEETRFEDGTVVRADFAKLELWVNGQQVPCPPGLLPAGAV